MENATFFRPRLQSHWKPLGAVTPNQLENVAFVLTMRSQNTETITFQAAARCCVTATLASETF